MSSRIRLDAAGERIVWRSGARSWRGFTPRGRKIAADLDVLASPDAIPTEEPSVPAYLARSIEALDLGIRIEELVDDPVERELPPGAKR